MNKNDTSSTSTTLGPERSVSPVGDKLTYKAIDLIVTTRNIEGIQVDSMEYMDIDSARRVMEILSEANSKDEVLVEEHEKSVREKDLEDPEVAEDLLEKENEICKNKVQGVIDADSVIKESEHSSIRQTDNKDEYDSLFSEMNQIISERDELVVQREREIEVMWDEKFQEIEHKKAEEEEKIKAEQEAPESSKRKRDDSEESQEPVDKKQKPGSLVDDFADPSQEFPGYTDGDD